MSSRIAFYVHVFVVVMCLAVGMSETYSWLPDIPDPSVLHPLCLLLLFANYAMPFVILAFAKVDQRTPGEIIAAVILSAVLTVAGLCALLPLVM